MESKKSIASLIFQYINSAKVFDTITRKELYKYVEDNGIRCGGKTTIDTMRRVYTWNGILTDTNIPGVYIKIHDIPTGITYSKLLEAYKQHIPIKINKSLLADIEL